MHLASFSFERPQRTHWWNNVKFRRGSLKCLSAEKTLSFAGAVGEEEPYIRIFGIRIPLFHIPIIGGWTTYVVLEPVESIEEWNVGWMAGSVRGASMIPIRGRVRVLRGNKSVTFFGIDRRTGGQITLRHVGSGSVGDRGPYRNILLL